MRCFDSETRVLKLPTATAYFGYFSVFLPDTESKRLGGSVKSRFPLPRNFGRSFLKKGFGRDTLQPALIGKFLVVGEIEPDHDTKLVSVAGFFGGLALKAMLQFIGQMKSLPPAVQLQARLLGVFFTPAKIED